MDYYSAVWIKIYLFVWRYEGRRAVKDSFSNTEELLTCVQGQQDDGDQQYKLQLNRWADAPNSIPIQNTHKWNVIKLEDVDSILDCDRVDIFYNLYSLVSPEIINLIT